VLLNNIVLVFFFKPFFELFNIQIVNSYNIGDPFLYWDEYFLTGSCIDLGGGANGRYSVPGVTANPPSSCAPINPVYNEYIFSDYLYQFQINQ